MNETGVKLTDEEMNRVIHEIGRSELFECPRSYLKAVRALLIALGYDEHWVEFDFRDALEDYWNPKIEADKHKIEDPKLFDPADLPPVVYKKSEA